MYEFFEEFALQIVIVIVVATGGSVFAYFANLKKCVRNHKEETNAKIEIVNDRSFRIAKAFSHFVRRNDELHSPGPGKSGNEIKLGDEIDNLLKDPKTGKF